MSVARIKKICRLDNEKNVSTAKISTSAGADVNTMLSPTTSGHLCPLHKAALNRDVATITRFLCRGFYVDSRDQNYCTALHVAAQVNHLDSHNEVMALLVQYRADINAQNGDNSTALHILGCKQGSCPAVRLLLNLGANVDINNIDGDVPLDSAIRSGNVGVVQLLVDHRSNVNHKNVYGSTPLHEASTISFEGYTEIVEILLKNGADVNAQDDSGNTPLHQLALHPRHEEKLVFLLVCNSQSPLNVNLKNNDGEIPLFFAIQNNQLDIVKLLVERGSDVLTASTITNLHPFTRRAGFLCKKKFSSVF